MKFARRTFDFVAAFAVIRGAAVGWDARGEGADPSKLAAVSIPLDATSVFRTVALTRGSYVGPLPPDTLSRHYLEQLGRAPPRTVFLFPVEVKSRLVAILYGDSGQKPVSQRRQSDLLLFCAGPSGRVPGAARPPQAARGPGRGGPRRRSLFAAPAPAAGLGWSPMAPGQLKGLGRAASTPGLVIADAERPPPDFAPILNRLTGPDAVGRARAIAELASAPEASSKVLAANFPGPTAWSRLPVVELPEADELGPIPGAIARLGRPGAQALAPLLDADDPDTRYFALLTAGNLPYPELVDGVLRGLFDLEPDLSSAARAAATHLRRLPRFDGAMRDLRQELAARDSIRRTLAARALGALRDKEAIEGLIGLTGSDDQMCAQAAAEALRDITKATLRPAAAAVDGLVGGEPRAPPRRLAGGRPAPPRARDPALGDRRARDDGRRQPRLPGRCAGERARGRGPPLGDRARARAALPPARVAAPGGRAGARPRCRRVEWPPLRDRLALSRHAVRLGASSAARSPRAPIRTSAASKRYRASASCATDERHAISRRVESSRYSVHSTR